MESNTGTASSSPPQLVTIYALRHRPRYEVTQKAASFWTFYLYMDSIRSNRSPPSIESPHTISFHYRIEQWESGMVYVGYVEFDKYIHRNNPCLSGIQDARWYPATDRGEAISRCYDMQRFVKGPRQPPQ